MAAGIYDWTIEQGTTVDNPVSWETDTGDPIDVTGYTARLQARETISSSVVLLELTTEDGGIIVDGPTGMFTLHISDTASSALDFPIAPGTAVAQAVYDLEIISPAGRVIRLLKGTITLDPEVTR